MQASLIMKKKMVKRQELDFFLNQERNEWLQQKMQYKKSCSNNDAYQKQEKILAETDGSGRYRQTWVLKDIAMLKK